MIERPSVSPTAAQPALKLPKDFQAMLDAIPAAPVLGAWRRDNSDAAVSAWTSMAEEARGLPEDKDPLAPGVTLAFRDDLSVRYVRECHSDDEDGGCFFLAYLFIVPDRLQVAAWVEDDGIHACMVYRGDHELVEEIGLQTKLFESCCFATAAEPQEPSQHIIRVPQ